MKRLQQLCCLAAASFLACSQGEKTAGSTFETENSVAKIFIVTPEGVPAANRTVEIHREDFLKGVDADSATALFGGRDSSETDESGILTLDSIVPGDYWVEVKAHFGESLRLGVFPVSISGSMSDSAGTFSVEENLPAALSGRIQTEKFPVSICLRGTSHAVDADSNGNFSFDGLPRGRFEIAAVYAGVVLGRDSVSVELSNESVVLSDTATKAFLFEDFEDGVGGWYTSVSEYATASLVSDSAGRGREGLAAHFKCQNDSANNWALMGRSFGGPGDLSGLDSVSFWARGDVKNYISLAFDVLADSVAEYESGKSWQHFEIDSAWVRYTVTPKTLLAPDSIGGNVGWDAVKSHVTNISIFGGAGGEVWIDDVTFYGVEFP